MTSEEITQEYQTIKEINSIEVMYEIIGDDWMFISKEMLNNK